MATSIDLLGSAQSSVSLCPWDKETWVTGPQAFNFPKASRIFEIHSDLSFGGEGYAERLASLGIPLVVSDKFPVKADHIEVVDFDAVERLYGSLYLTSSIAYMLAYAIMQEPESIGVYGVDMATDNSEYFYQRPCAEAWIGFARGKGIDVYIPETATIGRNSVVYGRDKVVFDGYINEDESTELARRHDQQKQALLERYNEIAHYEDEITKLKCLIHTHDGARQAHEQTARITRARKDLQDIDPLQQSVVTNEIQQKREI